MKNGLDCNKVGGSCRYLGKIRYILHLKKNIKIIAELKYFNFV